MFITICAISGRHIVGWFEADIRAWLKDPQAIIKLCLDECRKAGVSCERIEPWNPPKLFTGKVKVCSNQ